MGLFKSDAERMLDGIIQRLQMNMSNNYKDNAQANFKELQETFASLRDSGKIKGKALAKYEAVLEDYAEKLKGYSHKDQKPYWH